MGWNSEEAEAKEKDDKKKPAPAPEFEDAADAVEMLSVRDFSNEQCVPILVLHESAFTWKHLPMIWLLSCIIKYSSLTSTHL